MATVAEINRETHRARDAARKRLLSTQVAEIGPIPRVVDQERKDSCRYNLQLFLETYFPESTGLKPFSEDHENTIANLQECILEGGKFVNALPRGFAKTTISENTTIWATVYGHRCFVPIFGSTDQEAGGMIQSIKMELSENDLLIEDFPEVCWPIMKLENKSQRCATQTHAGKLTHSKWSTDKIVLPTIPGSPASGAIICCYGLMSASRGMKHKRPDGTQVRPDFVILDDPQTNGSAASPAQNKQRMDIIKKGILRMGGHHSKIAVVMNATVIQPDDIVDVLCSDQEPSWRSNRVKMLHSFSNHHEDLWLGKYADIRNTYDASVQGDQLRAHADATTYYQKNRKKMDEGCVASWEHCFTEDAGEVSAIQHAYNILIDEGEEAFYSECQNDPIRANETDGEIEVLPPAEIAKKFSSYERYEVPEWTSHLTSFIDVHDEILYYSVIAWSGDFDGAVVDYGTFPDQKRSHFLQARPPIPLSKVYQGHGKEGLILAGLQDLLTDLYSREWNRVDGASMPLEITLVDAGYKPQIVEQVARSFHSRRIIPAKGTAITAANCPITEWRGKHRGRTPYLVTSVKNRVCSVTHDSYFWKSFVHKRWNTAIGDPGCLSLFGSKASEHSLFAEHLVAEYPVKTFGRGRTVIAWKQRPSTENHWLDTVVGCAVAGHLLGLDPSPKSVAKDKGMQLPSAGSGAPATKKRKRRQKFRSL